MNPQILFMNLLAGKLGPPNASSCKPFSARGGFAVFLQTALKGAAGRPTPSKEITDLNGGKAEAGQVLLERLKDFLIARGIPLDQLSAGDDALEALKSFLLKAGFDADNVSRLLEELKNSNGKDGLKLSDLFAKLAQLKKEQDPEADTHLDASALPYLESIFALFNMKPETIRQVLAKSQVNGQGIHLDRLIAHVKSALKGESQDALSPPNAKALEQIQEMMARIGLEEGSRATTLRDFINRLETLARSRREHASSLAVLIDDLNRFSKEIRLDSKALADDIQKAAQQKEAALQSSLFARSTQREQPDGVLQAVAASARESRGKATALRPAPAQPAPEGESPLLQKVSLHSLPPDHASGGKSFLDAWASHLRNENFAKPDSLDAGSRADHFSLEHPVQNAAREARAAAEGQNMPRPMPRFVMEQVERRILTAALRGENEIQLRLNPPDLGRLHMSIEYHQDKMKVSILAENPATRDILLSQTSDMKSLLMDHGMHLEKLNVQVSLHFEQSLANARQDARNNQGRRRDTDSGEGEGAKTGRPAAQGAGAGLRQDGLIELIA